MDQVETEEIRNNDEELIEKIRQRFQEVETLIEGMKSKLPEARQ